MTTIEQLIHQSMPCSGNIVSDIVSYCDDYGIPDDYYTDIYILNTSWAIKETEELKLFLFSHEDPRTQSIQSYIMHPVITPAELEDEIEESIPSIPTWTHFSCHNGTGWEQYETIATAYPFKHRWISMCETGDLDPRIEFLNNKCNEVADILRYSF